MRERGPPLRYVRPRRYTVGDVSNTGVATGNGDQPHRDMEGPAFLRLFPLRAPNLMWLLGAGASAAAGVPTAWDLTWTFKQSIYASESRLPLASVGDVGDPLVQRRIVTWLESNGLVPPPSEDDYAYYFERAFPRESDRQRLIEVQVRGATPSYGHLVLAGLVSSKQCPLIWTTNFDGLIEDALSKLMAPSEITVASTENAGLANESLANNRWPLIAKLHGDFRSSRLRNTVSELAHQDVVMRQALDAAGVRFGLVVVGYSGRDDSVMEALESIVDQRGFPTGLFWLARDGVVTDRVRALVEAARAKGIDAGVVGIQTFDETMADITFGGIELTTEATGILEAGRQRTTAPPRLTGRRSWPVVRFNGLPVARFPSTCHRVVCEIGNTRSVREAVSWPALTFSQSAQGWAYSPLGGPRSSRHIRSLWN